MIFNEVETSGQIQDMIQAITWTIYARKHCVSGCVNAKKKIEKVIPITFW